MADDLRNRGPADPSRINIHDAWELEYWAGHFDVTKDKIKEAVAHNGVKFNDVKRYLRK